MWIVWIHLFGNLIWLWHHWHWLKCVQTIHKAYSAQTKPCVCFGYISLWTNLIMISLLQWTGIDLNVCKPFTRLAELKLSHVYGLDTSPWELIWLWCHFYSKYTTHQNGPVGSELKNWLFAISYVAVLSPQFWCKHFLNWTLHFGDLIDDIVTDMWKL